MHQNNNLLFNMHQIPTLYQTLTCLIFAVNLWCLFCWCKIFGSHATKALSVLTVISPTVMDLGVMKTAACSQLRKMHLSMLTIDHWRWLVEKWGLSTSTNKTVQFLLVDVNRLIFSTSYFLKDDDNDDAGGHKK